MHIYILKLNQQGCKVSKTQSHPPVKFCVCVLKSGRTTTNLGRSETR